METQPITSLSHVKPSDRKPGNAEYSVADPSLVVFNSLRRTTSVIYYGCTKETVKEGKTVKLKTTVTAKENREIFAKGFKNEKELEVGIKDLILKEITFDFENVWLDEVIKHHITQSTIYKLWYNSFLVEKSLSEIKQLPAKIVVKVRELLDSKKSSNGGYDKRLIMYQKALTDLMPKLMSGEIKPAEVKESEAQFAKDFEIKEVNRQTFA